MRINKTKSVMLFILYSCMALNAAPDVNEAFLCESKLFKLCHVNVDFERSADFAETLTKKKQEIDYAKISPGSIIKWGTVEILLKNKPIAQAVVWGQTFSKWLEVAKWNEDDAFSSSSLSPERIIVIEDKNKKEQVWVLHLWHKLALCFVGSKCDTDSFQIIPNSKQSRLDDRDLIEAIWDSVLKVEEKK